MVLYQGLGSKANMLSNIRGLRPTLALRRFKGTVAQAAQTSFSSSSSCQTQGSFPNDLGTTYLIGDQTRAHAKGQTEPPLLERTVDQHFRAAVESRGDAQAAVVCDGADHVDVRHSYNSLNAKVDDLARGLLRLGVKRGDRVGVWMPNNEAWLLTQLATARIGAILVCINPNYRLRELVHALNLVELSVLIMNPHVSHSNYIEMIHELIPDLAQRSQSNCREPIASKTVPCLKHIVLAEADGSQGEKTFIQFEDLLEKDGAAPAPTGQGSLQPDDPINIQFTSGTTGAPKGALLSSRNIVNNGNFVGACLRLTPQDIINVPVPLYHCFGMVMGNLASISHGSSVVYPARVFSPEKTLAVAESEKCTALYGVPTMFAAMLARQSVAKHDISNLRTGIMAGSNCPREMMRRVVAELNLTDVCIGYGQTESSPVSFMSRIVDDEKHRCETVGRITPHVEAKVINEDGEVVELGVPGELYVRGYHIFKGYYNSPEQTQAALTDDGWLRTGDLCDLDKNGYLRVDGRLKDVIIRGGENIAPRECEELIQEMPGVSTVAVVGVPDELFGEQVCAVIIPDSTVDAAKDLSVESVRSFVKANLSHQKVPKYVLFRESLQEFMTVTGKLRKFQLRDWAAQETKEQDNKSK
mmetsp:Transcript_407/g.951  ORF Transcript_407/g.951 Transcript_407/m.951 type:complete len:641 (-) Transcript_407:187-2109(-)|eukprot:CAMPEP_0171539782 /NCGR_PEP_ID=MMETSP0960-20121227/810_1 /TAXON_ID=87120 /ORGANISM="Aurantiochytrium limacinum, Strain ATCCMYA-1381" /LENGTH=640 /DNA_ID=CAMNT_0012086865 /DNA_START=472 /DNA_END=2394 /DNA_ORIENTATION=+